jgi:hypothetical protein
MTAPSTGTLCHFVGVVIQWQQVAPLGLNKMPCLAWEWLSRPASSEYTLTLIYAWSPQLRNHQPGKVVYVSKHYPEAKEVCSIIGSHSAPPIGGGPQFHIRPNWFTVVSTNGKALSDRLPILIPHRAVTLCNATYRLGPAFGWAE